MFAADNQREIERLESLLNRCQWENQQLKQQLTAKDQLIQSLTLQNTILESAKNNIASSKLYTHENSFALEQKVNRLQKFLQEQTAEADYMQQSKSTLIREVDFLSLSNNSNLSLIGSKDLLIGRLNLRIKELEDISKIQEERIEVLNNNIKNYEADKYKMIQISTNMALKFKQEENEKHNKFKTLFEGLNFLTEEIKNTKSQHKQRSQAEHDEKIILKLQHEELQQRNQEIMRIRNILDGMQIPMEENHLRNTIKHLRAELVKHNKKIITILEKEQYADSLIKKHNETLTRYEKEVKDIGNLKNQNYQLKQKINELQYQIKQMAERQEADKKLSLQNKALMTELLKENQCFHQMMYQNFGSGYTFYIENLKVQFENRFEERVKREKWASIEELIDVNEKLREKLKLK